MAVESRHLNLFPPRILCNREKMLNGLENTNNIYSTGMMYGGLSKVAPMTGTTSPAGEAMLPPPMAKNGTMRADDSNLITYAHHLPGVSRKRSREDAGMNSVDMNQLITYPTVHRNTNIGGGDNRSSAGQFMFLGEDLATQIQGQQLEVDNFFAHHIEKLRLEITERRKRYSRTIIGAIEERITKELKIKDVELENIVKYNSALDERMKSLCVENQIWRNLAQTNQATANMLRTNLDQLLTQVQDNNHHQGAADEEAQSSCGSNGRDQEPERRRDDDDQGLCRGCGKEEACVLLLPCRHLCLCSVCGSSQNICPVCKSVKNSSLHVNFE